MPARVVCMASVKGGSGKTILTATFAAFLAALGKRVLMVDTDAATNGLTLMYLKEVMVQADRSIDQQKRARGVYECADMLPDILSLPTGVHLVPAAYTLTNTELVSPERFADSLQRLVLRSRDHYDYVFLDAQAGSEPFALSAMSRHLADDVVIVTEYDPMSAAGVERLKAINRDDLTYDRTWVLLNKMLPEFVRSFSEFLEVARYLSPIPWDADVVRAYARRRLALDLESGNPFTLAVMNTLRLLLQEEIEDALGEWVEGRRQVLLEPVQDQLMALHVEYEQLSAFRSNGSGLLRRVMSLARQSRFEVVAMLAVLGAAVSVLFYTLSPDVRPEWSPWLILGVFMMMAMALFSERLVSTFDRELSERRDERRRVAERIDELDALLRVDLEGLLIRNSAILDSTQRERA